MQDKSVQGIWIFLITILKKHIVTVNVCFIQLVDKDTLVYNWSELQELWTDSLLVKDVQLQ